MKKLLKYWGPPLLWMMVIFFFSSRERLAVSDEYTVNFIFFKSLHVLEYAGLYFLLFRATVQENFKNQKKARLIALLIAFIYAASDELHQTFVPTREGRLRDVGIDTIGMGLMYIYTKYRFKSISRFL